MLVAGSCSAGIALGYAIGIPIAAGNGKGLGMPIIAAVFFASLATVCFATRKAIISEPEQATRTLFITSIAGILVTAVTAISCLMFLPAF